jgi:hypothetical protein
MSETGWIKLHRKMLGWEWFTDRNVFHVFIILLLNANHEDNKWRGITIKKGQYLTSLDKLSKKTKLSVAQVRLALNKLKSTHEITITTTKLNTLISISNWEKYQDNDKQNSKRVTNDKTENNRLGIDDNSEICQKRTSVTANNGAGENEYNSDCYADSESSDDKQNDNGMTNEQQTNDKRTANKIATNKNSKNLKEEKELEEERRTVFFATSQKLVESMCMKWGITLDQLNSMLDDFDVHILAEGKSGITDAEYRSYFHNWGVKRYTNYKGSLTSNGMVH